jgi:hypothetical protein
MRPLRIECLQPLNVVPGCTAAHSRAPCRRNCVEKPDKSAFSQQRILGYVRERGSINNPQWRELLGVGIHRAWYLLRKLQRNGAAILISPRHLAT